MTRILLLAIFSAPCVVLFSDEPAVDKHLLKRLVEAQASRVREFGDMHAVWHKHKVDEEGLEENLTIEFWSRENRYFRADIVNHEHASEGELITKRWIVRPEGFVRIVSRGNKSEDALVDYGSAEEGLEAIRSKEWFCISNRDMPFRQVADNVTNFLENKLDFDYKVTMGDDDTVVAVSNYGTVGNSSTCISIMSPIDFRVLSGTSNDDVTDRTGLSLTRLNTYGESHSIPTSMVQEKLWSNGDSGFTRYDLKEMQLGPADLEIFDIEAFKSSEKNNWNRRLAIFLVGISLIAIYLKFRKQPKMDARDGGPRI